MLGEVLEEDPQRQASRQTSDEGKESQQAKLASGQVASRPRPKQNQPERYSVTQGGLNRGGEGGQPQQRQTTPPLTPKQTKQKRRGGRGSEECQKI